MKIKVPQFLTQRPAFLTRKPASRPAPPKKLRAATASRRMAPAMDDDYDEEPTTRLSSAFFVVLILHVVAVGGIYAFNSIKAHRKVLEPTAATAKATSDKAATDSAAVAKQPITDPAPTDAKPSPATVAAAQAALAQSPNSKVYHVKAGDNLTKISTSLGVTVAELQSVNNPKDLAILRPGQILNVPLKKTPERFVAIESPTTAATPRKVDDAATKTAAATAKTYEVKKGDTATSIAKKYGVTVEELLKLNKVTDPKKLQLGQALKLPVKKVN